MGIHVENDTREYWSQRKDRPIHAAVHIAVGENRWHHIHRTFSISDLTAQYTTVFQRVALLNSHFWETSRLYWIPGRDLAVNKYKERFTG